MQGKDRGRKEEKTTSNNSNTYTNKVDKTTTTLYLIKKKKNEKVIAIKANKQANKGKMAKHIWVSNEIFRHEEHQEGLGTEREVRSSKDFEEFGDLVKLGCISWDTSYWIKSIAKWVSKHYGPKFPTHD
jgi:uncharacterized membrane protein